MKFLSLLLMFYAASSSASCRVSGSVSPRKTHRGMYVSLWASKIGSMPLQDPLSNILGNTTSENALLSFITKYQFDSLSLYDLPQIMSNSSQMIQLSTFIQAAKACGVTEVNAILGASSFGNTVKNYQASYVGKFDGLVTEIEFWNQSPVSSSFASFISQIQSLQTMGVTPPMITPYIGWLNRDSNMSEAQEAAIIAQNVGRVFVHAYVSSPSTAYGYTQSRVNALTAAKPSIPLWPIFSAEGVVYQAGSGDNFMGDWLAANSLDAAESTYSAGYKPAGFQYFEYSFLRMYLK